MWISAVIPLLLLGVVPLAYGAGAAASWLSVPVLFAGFAALERALGQDDDAPPSAPSTLAYRLPLWAYIAAQLGVILWGVATASHIAAAARLLGLAVSTGAAAGVFGMLAAHEQHEAIGALALPRGGGIVARRGVAVMAVEMRDAEMRIADGGEHRQSQRALRLAPAVDHLMRRQHAEDAGGRAGRHREAEQPARR